MTPWSTVAEQWTLPGLYDRADAGGIAYLLNQAGDSPEIEVTISKELGRMTDLYRQKFIQKFTDEFPETLSEMRTQNTRRIQALGEFRNYAATVSGVGDPVSQSGFYGMQGLSFGGFPFASYPAQGIYGVTQTVFPPFYLVDSTSQPINSALLAGVAIPGSYAGDVGGDMLYVNLGTTATPVWTRTDDSMLINYILNPDEVLECGYERAIYRICSRGGLAGDGAFIERMAVIPKYAGLQYKDICGHEELSFGLIRVDLAGTGIVTDAARSAGRVKKWVV